MNRKKIGFIVFCAIVVLGGAAVVLNGKEPPVMVEAETDVATVETRDLEIRAEAAGVIEPILVVEVKSKASGEILKLLVETGDFVPQGTVLAEIDPRDVQNSLDQAEADLEVAEVQAQTTKAQRDRVEELRQVNAMTQQEYESAIQSEASAKATLVRARTNLQLARMRRQDVQIAAPIAGTIIERTVEAGQIIASATSNVSGGTTLVKMADLSRMQVRALVDETDIGKVAPLQKVEVSVDAYPGQVFMGEVQKIEPQSVVEQNVTMFPVLIQLDNQEGLLKPGMNAEVVIQVAFRPGATVVPTGAVVSPADAADAAALLGAIAPAAGAVAAGAQRGAVGGDAGVVFVSGPGGIERREVVIGLSDWEFTEIRQGLNPGEKVMLVSVARMREQQAREASGPFGGGGGPPARGG